ncbi:hypothetical protein EI427_03745 [Flammeovirga pectinis]|uniref:DUF4252 domain-containing protein n=1 Tax=Flammeovirga pectinis TaxID=2494373 RepID=A0A3S9NZL2_9BACT|nr:hypothetical protein [Flammeovirga pectinis]AZQ61366.1 hypothetical protein EI427_03745 [Flammeovirga pectinis]
MKKYFSSLFLLFLFISSTLLAQNDNKDQIKLYKELYTGMSGTEVNTYLTTTLQTKREVNGDYKILFLNEEAFLLPIYENDQLKKVQIIFKNEDIEAIKVSLKHIEKAFSKIGGWKEIKTDKYVWLFAKTLDKKIQNKNEIAVYSLGIYHDEIGHRWHAILHVAPRLEDNFKITDEELQTKKSLISSDL